jgi:hypothetical protein
VDVGEEMSGPNRCASESLSFRYVCILDGYCYELLFYCVGGLCVMVTNKAAFVHGLLVYSNSCFSLSH